MSQRILITGSQGFIGTRLLAHLQSSHRVHAPVLDLFDYSSVLTAIAGDPWDTVIHLAGQSHIPSSEKNPEESFRVNLNGTALMLEALRKHSPKTHFIFASSAQVYARPSGEELKEKLLFEETRRIQPQNVYAETKWAAELLIRDTADRTPMRATILRLFNHSHKSQSADFFLPTLYSKFKNHKPGAEVDVACGNLDLYRDIGSLADLLSAFSAVIQMSPPSHAQTFNVCSGHVKHLRKLADGLAEHMNVRARFVTDPAKLRNEPQSICGSHEKLTLATGWKPSCKTESDLVKAFLDDAV